MKKCLFFKNSIACLCSAAVLMFSVFVNNDKVMADPQGVQLSLENVEVDINNISADRKVQVPVSISGNPGFKQLLFNVEKDPRLQFAQTPSENPFELKSGISSIDFYFLSDDNQVLRGQFTADSIYTENNSFTSVGFILPEQLSAGDEFTVSFNSSFYDSSNNYYTYGIDINDGNNIYPGSSFLTGVNASIRIVDSSAVSESDADNYKNIYSFSGDVDYGFDNDDDDKVTKENDTTLSLENSEDDEQFKFRENHIKSFDDDEVFKNIEVYDGDAENRCCFIIICISVVIIVVTVILFRIFQLNKRKKSGIEKSKKKAKKK